MKRGIFFTLDVALCMFFLIMIFSAQADLLTYNSPSLDVSHKLIAENTLNTMEKSDFLNEIANGQKTQSEVQTYLTEVLPSNVAAEFSQRTYKYNSGFQLYRTVNTSVGTVSTPFSFTKRVGVIPRKGDDYYIVTELKVGFK
ncbi:MAG: hypothetical protein V1722_05640 [Candidatus Micrarchaeota archaeon]